MKKVILRTHAATVRDRVSKQFDSHKVINCPHKDWKETRKDIYGGQHEDKILTKL